MILLVSIKYLIIIFTKGAVMAACPDCGNIIKTGVDECHFCGRTFHHTFNIALKCPSKKSSKKGLREEVTHFQRISAGLLDFLYFLVPTGLALFFLNQPLSETTPTQFIAQSWFIFTLFSLFQLFLMVHDGQSVGKKIMKIAVVVHGTHDHPSPFQIIVLRTMIPAVPMVLPLLGLVLYGVNLGWALGDEHRCLHDFIAGTDVVHE